MDLDVRALSSPDRRSGVWRRLAGQGRGLCFGTLVGCVVLEVYGVLKVARIKNSNALPTTQ